MNITQRNISSSSSVESERRWSAPGVRECVFVSSFILYLPLYMKANTLYTNSLIFSFQKVKAFCPSNTLYALDLKLIIIVENCSKRIDN
jgi:hypothetical protein